MMVMAWVGGFFACQSGMSNAEFATAYSDLYCERFFECADESLLVFDGVESVEQCLAAIGPSVSDDSVACELNEDEAVACLDEFAVVMCPEEGATLDDVVPQSCASAWEACQEL